ncbi:extracellular solute-binding protein [Ruania alkalisoli]|uniref:Extracellular solute-binding protein n=1 Tax=Ruania alkalisoli TaxID=2779775 RepID=A0A7M1STA8_9MICO|nr:extracellular solute-binding protein [Ruania alkalisoli]QOR70808.1 extracellular solute-binding protein [Ruania alkalisoli]
MTTTGVGVLTGCGSEGGDATPTASGSGSGNGPLLPTYIEYTGVTPDLSSTPEGALAGYFRYPDPQPRAGAEHPAAGLDSVEILYPTYQPVPLEVSENPFWQELNDRAGASMDLLMTPAANYDEKFQTMLAGGTLPEITVISGTPPRLSQILSSQFADLSEYLAGDLAAEYPSLANIPTVSWQSCVVGGVLYGVPQPRPIAGGPAMFYDEALVNELGLDPNPTSMDDYRQLMRDATDESAGRFGCSNPERMLIHVAMMLGAPNKWRQADDGSFVSAVADERTKEALAITRSMVEDGIFPPNWVSSTYSDKRDTFTTRKAIFHPDGDAAWSLFQGQLEATVSALPNPGPDGQAAPHHCGNPRQGMTVIRRDLESERIKRLLSTLDWLATPIGTLEHLFRKFGTEGSLFTWDGGIPSPVEGATSQIMDLQYIVDGPSGLGPAIEDDVRHRYEWYAANSENLELDASLGLYSETQAEVGGNLTADVAAMQLDILAGRKDIGEWDDFVTTWRANGGDAVAAELQEEASR